MEALRMILFKLAKAMTALMVAPGMTHLEAAEATTPLAAEAGTTILSLTQYPITALTQLPALTSIKEAE